MEIKIELTKTPKAKPTDETKLGFGHVFTDHMFAMNYDTGKGWHDARIVPFDNVTLSPAAMCLHYGQEIFEGLKAYRTADGTVQLFRPDENYKRMNVSAERMVIPQIDEEFMVEATKKLVEIEKDWVPHTDGASLYIRPFIFATDPFVGVRPADHYTFLIILSPSGAYYAHGIKPVKIYVEDKYVRAVRGGTGFTKCAGNYGCSLIAQTIAHDSGYEQVLWLDGVEQKYIEEVGAMNIMFIIDGKLVTPSLAAGSILPGITRRSCIEIAKDMGLEVEERKISIDEVIEAGKSGRMQECFGCGTAAVVSPVGELKYEDTVININNGEIGPITQKFYDTITGIQSGKVEDKFGWVTKVN